MDDDATAVKQRLSVGGVMRRLVAGDYAVNDCNLFFGLWCAVALLGVVHTRS